MDMKDDKSNAIYNLKQAIRYNGRYRQAYEKLAKVYEHYGDTELAAQVRAQMSRIPKFFQHFPKPNIIRQFCRMKIAVIGAGPAGMTAAYKLSEELGQKISELHLYEISDQVGGLSKSIDLWGQRVDLGPHRFFTQNTKINELWLEVVGKEYDIVIRQTRIYYKKKFFDYPMRALNALKGLGLIEAARCMTSYFFERLAPTKDTSTFEGWVTSRFGKRLFTIFFKTYSEKLWGISCTDLDSDFAAQRIKKLSLYEAVKNALIPGQGE